MKNAVKWMVAIMIAVVVAGSFQTILGNGWVWDDKHNFVENPSFRGLSPSHLLWMFTTFHDANYHPICWMSLGADYLLWGMNPAGYHFSNLMLHVCNTLILFFFIQKIWTRKRNGPAPGVLLAGSGVATLFFALHPLRVETVAFISTRGDLLSCLFYLMTATAYISMVEGGDRQTKRKWFWLALAAFNMSLLSRAWGITLPVVLLILDIYPLRRLSGDGSLFSDIRRLLVEKIPFFAFALLAAAVAVWAKKGPMVAVADHSVADRLAQSAYGLGFYVWKTVFPTQLSPLYLLKADFSIVDSEYFSYAAFAVGITLLLFFKRRHWPWALCAWCVYGVIVSPLLGLVQSGPQIAADRYTYIACIPFAVLAGGGAISGWKVLREKRNGPVMVAGAGFCIVVLAGLFSYGTYRQTLTWYNDDTLWSQAIRTDPSHYIAYGNRGVFRLEGENDPASALEDYNRAISLQPENSGFYYNRGMLYELTGVLDAAIEDYTRVIRLDPDNAKAYNNRGGLLKRSGDLEEALEDFNRAVQLAPTSPEAYANRGMLWLSQKDLKKAENDLKKAISMAPDDWVYREDAVKMIRQIESGQVLNSEERSVY